MKIHWVYYYWFLLFKEFLHLMKSCNRLICLGVFIFAFGSYSNAEISSENGELIENPSRFGLSIDYQYVKQRGVLTELSVDIGDAAAVAGLVDDIEGEVYGGVVKGDYQVLPFLNVFLFGGYLAGETSVTFQGGLPPIAFEYEGFVGGVGSTLTVGTPYFWGGVTGTLAKAWWDNNDDNSVVWTLTPKVGTTIMGTVIWAGVSLWWLEEERSGIAELQGVPINFESTLEQRRVASPIVGFLRPLPGGFSLYGEFGFGARDQVFLGLQKRF